ncbi:MAG TPA: 23S rRNA (guanosine(2251)-2'-O)-methyltransferase RlmB [Caulobacteraceae bacterium]|nr:23S rRNA (guanosine(2251)-2'-O)-methyltransferase RlmB [Caulobacteraceae bacterium]
MWGRHAVTAALANPARAPFKRLLLTLEAQKAAQADPSLRALLAAAGLTPEVLGSNEIARLLPPGSVHQGLALSASPLEPLGLEEIADPAQGLLVMLDGVTDPQNVGAVFRSAAAFGARGVILQDRHAPNFSGAMVKAAAGAMERVPEVRVVNLNRALERLADLGWRTVGLDGGAASTLAEVLHDPAPTVLVLGSEGEGLRRLVGEHCDVLARIPMPGGFESLNVSAAAAVALYEASKKA